MTLDTSQKGSNENRTFPVKLWSDTLCTIIILYIGKVMPMMRSLVLVPMEDPFVDAGKTLKWVISRALFKPDIQISMLRIIM